MRTWKKNMVGCFIFCKTCNFGFRVPHCKENTKFCSRKCLFKDKEYLERNKTINLGRPSWKKGKSRFKNEEEKRLAMLESGRKSYRKHIETRLFYYRKLAQIRRGVEGNFTLEEWEGVLKRQKYKCLLCEATDKKLTIDHIIPISKWQEWLKNNPVSYKCGDIKNIQALCKSCNSRKNNKML